MKNNKRYGKVKRLISDCCGMEKGKIYDAIIDNNYIDVKLPDGTYTGPHFRRAAGHNEFFEIIEDDK